MGTFGTGILADDAALDAHTRYLRLYDLGQDPRDIRRAFEEDNAWAFETGYARDNAGFWLGLAQAQWECKALDADVLAMVRRIVEEETDLADRGDDAPKRRAVLKRFLAKLRQPKQRARKPVAPRTFDAPFHRGECVAFAYPDDHFGAAICLGASEGRQRIATSLMAVTRVRQPRRPTIDDVLDSHILWLTWGLGDGPTGRRAAKPDISNRAVSTPGEVRYARRHTLLGTIPIERPFGDQVPWQGFDWDLSTLSADQLAWEDDHPEAAPDLSLPVRDFVSMPADPAWAELGRAFAEAWTAGRSHQTHEASCRTFIRQMRSLGFSRDSEELCRFIADFAGCSLDRAENRIANICRNSRL